MAICACDWLAAQVPQNMGKARSESGVIMVCARLAWLFPERGELGARARQTPICWMLDQTVRVSSTLH
jgi:hypothetical protein